MVGFVVIIRSSLVIAYMTFLDGLLRCLHLRFDGFFFFFFFFFFFIVCKITLLTLLTVRAKYITRQYSILPTIHAYWLLTLLNKTGLYLQFNTDSLKHNSN